MALIKILVVLVFGLIAFQDFKGRAVYWILFPIMGAFLAALFLYEVSFEQYFYIVGFNIVLVSLVLLVLYAYTKYVAKKQFLNFSFGLGDLLFFYAFALGYPTYTFLILFVASIFFSLLAFLFIKFGTDSETIPLAGLMGLFLIGITVASTIPNVPSLYVL